MQGSPVARSTSLCLALAFASATGLRTPDKASGSAATAEAPAEHRATLDVGFSSFEGNLTGEVTKLLKEAPVTAAWSARARDHLSGSMAEKIRADLKAAIAPVKASIGQTWMALPQDNQKDEYVGQLRAALTPVFATSLKGVSTHLNLAIQRLPKTAPEADAELEHCSVQLSDSLMADHCYNQTLSKKVSFIELSEPHAAKPLDSFCIQSVMTGLVRRLNDTQGLVSMSMRFESGAMSLAQQHAQKKA